MDVAIPWRARAYATSPPDVGGRLTGISDLNRPHSESTGLRVGARGGRHADPADSRTGTSVAGSGLPGASDHRPELGPNPQDRTPMFDTHQSPTDPVSPRRRRGRRPGTLEVLE